MGNGEKFWIEISYPMKVVQCHYHYGNNGSYISQTITIFFTCSVILGVEMDTPLENVPSIPAESDEYIVVAEFLSVVGRFILFASEETCHRHL